MKETVHNIYTDDDLEIIQKEVLNKIQLDGTRNITINIGGDVDGNIVAGDENEIVPLPTNSRKKPKSKKK